MGPMRGADRERAHAFDPVVGDQPEPGIEPVVVEAAGRPVERVCRKQRVDPVGEQLLAEGQARTGLGAPGRALLPGPKHPGLAVAGAEPAVAEADVDVDHADHHGGRGQRRVEHRQIGRVGRLDLAVGGQVRLRIGIGDVTGHGEDLACARLRRTAAFRPDQQRRHRDHGHLIEPAEPVEQRHFPIDIGRPEGPVIRLPIAPPGHCGSPPSGS